MIVRQVVLFLKDSPILFYFLITMDNLKKFFLENKFLFLWLHHQHLPIFRFFLLACFPLLSTFSTQHTTYILYMKWRKEYYIILLLFLFIYHISFFLFSCTTTCSTIIYVYVHKIHAYKEYCSLSTHLWFHIWSSCLWIKTELHLLLFVFSHNLKKFVLLNFIVFDLYLEVMWRWYTHNIL